MGVRSFRWLLGLALLSVAIVTALPKGETFAQDATLTLQPTSGPPGTAVSISGAFLGCLSRSTDYQIMWDGSLILVRGNTVPTATFGGYGFHSSFVVPSTAAPGPHNVVVPAKTAPCWGSPSVVFTVTEPGASVASPTPSPTLSPTATSTRTPTPTSPSVGGSWVSPEDGHTVADVVQLAARVAPVGTGTPGAIGVNFIAAVPSVTPSLACAATVPDADGVFGCAWNVAGSGFPAGEIHIAFDVNDQAGQVNRAPAGTRSVRYAPMTPTTTPQPTAAPAPPEATTLPIAPDPIMVVSPEPLADVTPVLDEAQPWDDSSPASEGEAEQE